MLIIINEKKKVRLDNLFGNKTALILYNEIININTLSARHNGRFIRFQQNPDEEVRW